MDKISGKDQYWIQVAAHTGVRNSNGTPWSVQQIVAGLVGNAVITDSAVVYTPDGPSIWDVFVVTEDGRLIRVRVEFELQTHGFEEEESPYRKGNPVAATVHEAWVRKLSAAVRLDVDAVRVRANRFGEPSMDELDLSGVRLTFDDGFELDLGIDQKKIYDVEERNRVDRFIAAVRSHSKL